MISIYSTVLWWHKVLERVEEEEGRGAKIEIGDNFTSLFLLTSLNSSF